MTSQEKVGEDFQGVPRLANHIPAKNFEALHQGATKVILSHDGLKYVCIGTVSSLLPRTPIVQNTCLHSFSREISRGDVILYSKIQFLGGRGTRSCIRVHSMGVLGYQLLITYIYQILGTF